MTTTAPHQPPVLASSVHEVLVAFRDRSNDWSGLRVLEAVLVMDSHSRQVRYRWLQDGLHVVVADLGTFHPGGAVATRAATQADHRELEEGLAGGWVEITEFDRMTHETRVLHQATLRPLPMAAHSTASANALTRAGSPICDKGRPI